MTEVSIQELRNHGGEVVEMRAPLSAEVLLARRRRLPPVDPLALRADVDRLLEVVAVPVPGA
jgi:hypothetical protein